MIFTCIAIAFACAYAWLQGYYLWYWKRSPRLSLSPLVDNSIAGVSVILVARNEGQVIGSCLQGLLQQDFPSDRMEIIVIDDHSTDDTVHQVQHFEDARIRLFHLHDYPDYIHPPAFKKSGIVLAADQARFDLLVVTDADCLLPAAWLRTITNPFTDPNLVFQTAPVLLNTSGSWVEKMQEMEQLTLMLITGAGITSGLHDMANGANMAFRRSAFRAVGDFAGNWSYASGDDMFLVEKMRAQFPKGIAFAKSMDAVVETQAKTTWQDLFRQRLRWAGKNKGLSHLTIQRIWMFVGAYHLLLVVNLVAALCNHMPWMTFVILLLSKWLFDFVVVYSAASFFRQSRIMMYFLPLQLMYGYYLLRLGSWMLIGREGDWQRAESREQRA